MLPELLGPMIHCYDFMMGTIASQITSLTIVYSKVYLGADQRKHQSSMSLTFVWGIHRWLTSNAANVSIWLCRHVTSQSLTCGTKLRDELQYLNLIWKMFLQTMFVIHTANTLDAIMHQYCQHYIFHVKYILSQNPLLFMGLPSILQFL